MSASSKRDFRSNPIAVIDDAYPTHVQQRKIAVVTMVRHSLRGWHNGG